MKKAFSFIEISIVILVIGILISGLLKSMSMLDKAKVRSARMLTNSSPVNGIYGLVLWYETSLEESVMLNSKGNVTRWNDINPQSLKKIDAVPYNYNSPVAEFTHYDSNGVNGVGIPSMYFDGVSNDGFNIPSIPVVGTDSTFFLVEQHEDGALNGNNNGIVCQLGSASSFCIRYGSTSINYGWLPYNAYSSNIGLNAGSKILVHTFIFKYAVTNGFEYYLDGNVKAAYAGGTTNSNLNSATNYNNVKIGYKSSGQFKGNIFEIIVFNKALKKKERESVEEYIMKKYGTLGKK